MLFVRAAAMTAVPAMATTAVAAFFVPFAAVLVMFFVLGHKEVTESESHECPMPNAFSSHAARFSLLRADAGTNAVILSSVTRGLSPA